MITFDGKPIYPPRLSRTIAYPLKQGEVSEQSLYDAVTAYCEKYFDLAGQYNRSAAKMAMMVLQRRLASSTYRDAAKSYQTYRKTSNHPS